MYGNGTYMSFGFDFSTQEVSLNQIGGSQSRCIDLIRDVYMDHFQTQYNVVHSRFCKCLALLVSFAPAHLVLAERESWQPMMLYRKSNHPC